MAKVDPLKPTAAVLCRIASIVVHADEMMSDSGHAFDRAALQSLLIDRQVRDWLRDMGKLGLLPVKR